MHSQTEANRQYYSMLRRVCKCPVIYAYKTSWGYAVETKDGEVYLEQVKASDSWDAKAQGVMEWIHKRENKSGGR